MRFSSKLLSILKPHPSFTYLPNFLTPTQQSILLDHSLNFLSSPSFTTSSSRKLARNWKKQNPEWKSGFMKDEAYEFETNHFDKVITGYRECVVSPNSKWNKSSSIEIQEIMKRLYDLLPPLEDAPVDKDSMITNPPSHLQLHLLHLSKTGIISPHVDSLEASGNRIVGVSLGGDRIMKFKKVEGQEKIEGPEEFEIEVKAGSVYIQTGDLRANYTHELPMGTEQRLSLMLRDQFAGEIKPPSF